MKDTNLESKMEEEPKAKSPKRRYKSTREKLMSDSIESIAILKLQGKSDKNIQELLNLRPKQLQYRVNSEEFRAVFDRFCTEFRENQRRAIADAVPVAIKTLLDLAGKAKSEHVRYEAANALILHSKITEEVIEKQENVVQALQLVERIINKVRDLPRPAIPGLPLLNPPAVIEHIPPLDQVIDVPAQEIPTEESPEEPPQR